MGQSDLRAFGNDHPTAEARAVAGDGPGGAAAVVDAAKQRFPPAEGHVELAVTQVDYTLAGSGRDERPVLHVFGRTAADDLEHVRVHGFRPYFYAPTDSLTDEALDHDVITETEPGYTSIRGEALTRIYARTPRDVGQIRDAFDHFEADILFPNRLLIDQGITSGVRVPARRAVDGAIDVPHDELEAVDAAADLRVHTLDIEVDDRSGFPEHGEQPVVCLTSHDSYRDEYVVWHTIAPEGDGVSPESLPDHTLLDGDAAVEVRSFDSEEAMLAAYLDYVDETDADVMTGWNIDDFDAPYLIARLKRLDGGTEYDLDYNRLSRVDEVWESDWQGPNVKGRVVFDLLYGYKRTQFTELDSYRLDAVAEVELGVGKERYAGAIGDLWERDPARLLEYNLRDVELCVELDRKQEVIAFWREVATFVGCKLEDATTPGDAVDMYVLHKAHGKFALPSKGRQSGEEFEGGAVFDPITGVREMVAVLDLASLYPMAMVTMNASPETKVDESFEGETYVAPNGQRFRKEPDGIMREMVDELLEEREEKKARRDEHEPGSEAYRRYDRQQASVKVIMNSLYGVSGWERFRLYDKDSASAVTATGREVIKFTEEVAREIDRKVIYGDSVTGDRPVVVRDPDGMVRIIPIEQLFQRATVTRSNEMVVTADGGVVANVSGKERRSLDRWDALSVNESGKSEWKPVKQVIRHETQKPIIKLQHKYGESTTTSDHSYLVQSDTELVEASPADVTEPFRVATIPSVEQTHCIDVYEVLSGHTRGYEDGRGAVRDNAVTKVKRVHTDGDWVWFGHAHHGNQDKTVKVKRHIDLASEDGASLVRLLAAYIAEGSASTKETTDSRFGASISESNREWMETVQSDYYRLFSNTSASIIASDTRDERTVRYRTDSGDAQITYDDRTLKLQMMSELAAVFFREFAGQTSRGKRIPSFIFHLNEELQSLFIDTLIEGDGSREFPRYAADYRERHFDFETTSRELAAGLSILLTQRGTKHSLKYRDVKGSYTIRTCDHHRTGSRPVLTEVGHDGYVYDLSVQDNENFVDGLGGIVLHNTDSVMVELGGAVSLDDAIEQSLEIQDHINRRYDSFAREKLNAEFHRFELEFEKLYRRFFQAGKKKRYAGHIVWKEGNVVDDIDITGFEYKRSDIAPVTKRVQREVIEMIVRGRSYEEVTDYVHRVIEEFQAGALDLDDIGIPSGIGQGLDEYDTDTAHVRGAKYANLLFGTNFQRGSKPKRLYLKKVHPEFFREFEADRPGIDEHPLYLEFKRNPDVICFEYADQVPEAFQVDWEKMLEKTLRGPIARVLEALDISWEEAYSGHEQTGLESYM